MNLYSENKILNENEFNEKRVFLQSKPLSLRLILTNRCNISCIMCELANQKDKFTIPYEVIKQIFCFFPYLERIDWQGGEVFLVGYFEEIIQTASAYPNIHQTLQTNGLLLDKKWAELLAKHNISVLFSVDGAKRGTYEYIRQGAKFEDLLRNISIFSEYKKKYNSIATKILCVCIMRTNYMELEEFVEFAIKYDFNRISFGAIHGTNAFNENIFNPIDSKAIDYLREKMPAVEKRCEEKGIILECSFKPYLNIGKEGFIRDRNNIISNNKVIKCKLPWTNFCIDAIRDGDIYPECLCTKSIGNIKKDSLLDIWNSAFMQQYRLAIASQNMRNICSEYCTKIKDN